MAAWQPPSALQEQAASPLFSVVIPTYQRRDKVVDAVLSGKPTLLLTPLTHVGVRVHGLMPTTTTRVMGLANRLLPKAPQSGGSETLEGHQAQQRLDSPVVNKLTAWGRTAAERFNERRGSSSVTL